MTVTDTARVTTHWTVSRWDAEQTGWVKRRTGLLTPGIDDFHQAGVQPYLTTEVHGNLATTAGLTRLTSLLTAGGGQAIVATSARIGVGNGGGTAAVGDTDLSASAGSSNRWFQVLDATYPQVSGGVLTLKATFGGSDANFAWSEFGIDIGTPTVTSGATVNATLFNHKTAIAQGSKASGQTWAATASVSFA
jgi:hypothetical protein